jgi:hypothetical protein
LAALVSPVQNNFSSPYTISIPLSPIAQQAKQAAVLGRLSFSRYLLLKVPGQQLTLIPFFTFLCRHAACVCMIVQHSKLGHFLKGRDNVAGASYRKDVLYYKLYKETGF